MREHALEAGGRRWHGTEIVRVGLEPLDAIQGFFSTYGPAVLQGCEITGSGPYNIAAGLIALNHEDGFKVAKFAAVTGVTLPGYITISKTENERAYDDDVARLSSYDYDAVYTPGAVPGGIPPNDYILVEAGKELPDFADVFAGNSLTPWEQLTSLNASTQVISKVYVRINRASRLLYLKGEVTFAAANPAPIVLPIVWGANFPEKYKPATRYYFTGHVRHGDGENTPELFKEHTQVDYLRSVSCMIDGTLGLRIVKQSPDMTATNTFTFFFNEVIPLD